jgi:hypothetical protein
LIGTVFHWDFYPYQGENRRLAEFPDFKTLPLAKLPAAFDAYCNDHFGFRNTFLRRYNRLSKKILHTSRVMHGADGWMFLRSTIHDYMGFRKYTEPSVKALSDTLISRKAQAEKAGITCLAVIAPDKIKVYPDKLENLNPPPDTIRRMDQLEAALPTSFKTNLLYLCDALKAARTEREVYYANDTHWTDYGAYIGYLEIIRRLRTWHPGLKELPLDAFDIVKTSHIGDLSILSSEDNSIPAEIIEVKNSMGISATNYPVGLAQNWHAWRNAKPPQLFTNPAGQGRLLVFHDSFGGSLMKFLPSNFEQTAFFLMYSSPEALDALIKEFRPDCIIEIHVERRMELFLTRIND